MNTFSKNNKGFLIIVAMTTLTIAFLVSYFFINANSAQVLTQDQIAELRKEYPAYNRDPDFVSLHRSTFLEIVDIAENVIIGEVISELPPYEVDLSQSGDVHTKINDKQDSLGLPVYKPKFVQYEVAVDKVIDGEPIKDTIILTYNADFIGYEPELKKGMKVITAIAAGRDLHEGKHFFTRSGTYYIVNNKNVLSTVDDEYSKLMNGQTVNQLIDDIKNRVK